MIWIIFSALISIQAVAKDCGPFSGLEDEAFEVFLKDLSSAQCRTDSSPVVEEIQEWIKAQDSGNRISKNVRGIMLENENSDDIRSFEYLIKGTDFFNNPNDSDINAQDFKSCCKSIDCAMKEVFGEKIGPKLFYLHRRYGLNGSELNNRISGTKWTEEELDSVLKTLKDYPDDLFPVSKNMILMRQNKNELGRAYAPMMAYKIPTFILTQDWTQGEDSISH